MVRAESPIDLPGVSVRRRRRGRIEAESRRIEPVASGEIVGQVGEVHLALHQLVGRYNEHVPRFDFYLISALSKKQQVCAAQQF